MAEAIASPPVPQASFDESNDLGRSIRIGAGATLGASSFLDAGEAYEAQMADHEHRLAKLRAEIKEARTNADRVERRSLTLVREMIDTWRQISDIRTERGYQSTRIRLRIQPIETDYDDDVAVLNDEITERLAEAREDHESAYERAYLAFETRRARREERLRRAEAKRARREARREARAARAAASAANGDGGPGSSAVAGAGVGGLDDGPAAPGSLSDDDADGNLDLSSSSSSSLSSGGAGASDGHEPLVEPQYAAFDAGRAEADIRDELLTHRRRPGEPILIPIVSETETITAVVADGDEVSRRKEVSKYKCALRVLINGRKGPTTRAEAMELATASIKLGEIHEVGLAAGGNVLVYEGGVGEGRGVRTPSLY